MRIVQTVYKMNMSGTAAACTTCQAIQLGFCPGCECSCLFVPHMYPFDFAVSVNSFIYMVETITCYCIDSLNTCLNKYFH